MSNSDTGLLLIDWQLRLFPAMSSAISDRYLKNASNLKWIFESLQHPIWVTEQYPKGLGPTLKELQPVNPFEKTSFSALGNHELREKVLGSGIQTVFVSGMETHICIYQTAKSLMKQGIKVVLAADACLSRRKLDWQIALDSLSGAGAEIMTTEMILFDLIQDASHPLFKEVSRRIK